MSNPTPTTRGVLHRTRWLTQVYKGYRVSLYAMPDFDPERSNYTSKLMFCNDKLFSVLHKLNVIERDDCTLFTKAIRFTAHKWPTKNRIPVEPVSVDGRPNDFLIVDGNELEVFPAVGKLVRRLLKKNGLKRIHVSVELKRQQGL